MASKGAWLCVSMSHWEYHTEASYVHYKVNITYPKVLAFCYIAKKQVTLQIAYLIKNMGNQSIISRHTWWKTCLRGYSSFTWALTCYQNSKGRAITEKKTRQHCLGSFTVEPRSLNNRTACCTQASQVST